MAVWPVTLGGQGRARPDFRQYHMNTACFGSRAEQVPVIFYSDSIARLIL